MSCLNFFEWDELGSRYKSAAAFFYIYYILTLFVIVYLLPAV
jgi:hypothetical protein